MAYYDEVKRRFANEHLTGFLEELQDGIDESTLRRMVSTALVFGYVEGTKHAALDNHERGEDVCH